VMGSPEGIAHLNAFVGARECVMKPIASAIVCIAVLYFVDLTYVDGKYFDAATAVASHILHAFWFHRVHICPLL
jgi:energy-converting hydrogenase Eha subunit B